MPGKYLVEANGAILAQQLGARWNGTSDAGAWPDRVFPKLRAPVVVWFDGGRLLRSMQFGFFPPFAKDAKSKTVHNARWETVAELMTFRGPFHATRCLVPLNGFWEYSEIPDPPRWYGWLAPKGRPMGVAAGIWTSWRPAGGSAVDVFALITRDAPENARRVGVTRIPVWLREENWDPWLDPRQRNTRTLEHMLEQYDAVEMVVEQQSPPPRAKKAESSGNKAKPKDDSPNLSFDFGEDANR